MNSLCYINGSYKNYKDIFLHISDLSIQRAYGVFDFMQSISDKIPFIDDHLDRFYYSAVQLHLPVPLTPLEIKEIIHRLVTENKFALAGIKLLLTGGYSDDGYTPSQPNFIILHLPFSRPDEKLYTEGSVLITHNYKREIPQAKTIDYIAGISVLQKMQQANAADVLFVYDNLIYECTRCNIFLVKDKVIITPGIDILSGITRQHVLLCASQFYSVEERPVLFSELLNADECFITSTTKGIMPVRQIDDNIIGKGMAGKITEHLRAAFSAKI